MMDKGRRTEISILVLGVVAILIFNPYLVRDFWHDEAFTYLYAQNPIQEFMAGTDVHPPLFTLVAKNMLYVTKNIYTLRFFMLILGVATAFSFFYVVRQLMDTHTAMAAYIMLCLSPTFQYYATEFRPYILVMLLTVWQVWAFNRMLLQQQGWLGLAYSWLTVAMLYSHYMSALIVVCQVVYLAYKRRLGTYWAEYIIIGTMLIPIYSLITRTTPNIESFWFTKVGVGGYISTYFYAITPPQHVVGTIYAFIILFLAGYGVLMMRKTDIAKQFMLYVFLPATVMFWVSQWFRFYHHRYFLFGMVFLYMFAGHALIKSRLLAVARKEWVYAACGMFILFIPTPVNYELSEASMVINDSLTVVHTSTFSQTPMKVYLPENQHLLWTNLTKKQLFTAGGAVVADTEIIRQLPDPPYWLVSDTKHKGDVKYEKGGLFVVKR